LAKDGAAKVKSEETVGLIFDSERDWIARPLGARPNGPRAGGLGMRAVLDIARRLSHIGHFLGQVLKLLRFGIYGIVYILIIGRYF
jgi:hypothetical protein